LNRALSTDR